MLRSFSECFGVFTNVSEFFQLNEHFATYPESGELKMLWRTSTPSPVDEQLYEATGHPLPNTTKLDLSFRRTAIGLSMDPLFVTVVGERHFEYQENEETVYVVLDEALDTDILTKTLQSLIELKDRYHVKSLFCQEPLHLEGLTSYPEPHIKQLAQQRWPSFVNFDLTCQILPRETPDVDSMASQLNIILSDMATDPKTGMEMIGSDGDPIPKLLFFDDFPVYRTMHSMRSKAAGGTTALWLAVHGLMTSRVWDLDEPTFSDNRNPAGY